MTPSGPRENKYIERSRPLTTPAEIMVNEGYNLQLRLVRPDEGLLA